MRTVCRSLSLAVLACCSVAVTAVDKGEPSTQYLEQRKELEQMLERRNLELYEFHFTALAFDQVALQDRLGNVKIVYYMTFRLRNQMGDAQSQPWSEYKGYNEVLATIAQQYEAAKVTKEAGTALAIADVKEVPAADAVILRRDDAQVKPRQVAITAVITDENGTRLRLLDDKPGAGPQETFNFADMGDTSISTVSQLARTKVEETVQRKLLLTDEIRTLTLPPYDATKRNEYGWADGEVYGVLLFNDLSDLGDHFMVEVRGLSNKYRIHWPETPSGKVEDYLTADFLRRSFVLEYDRPGDEHQRDLDSLVLIKSGWQWRQAFQRIAERKAMAYSRYYLSNIATQADEVVNKTVEEEFWVDYATDRKSYDKLPDLQAELNNREVPK